MAKNRLLILIASVSLLFIFAMAIKAAVSGKYAVWFKKDKGSYVLGITDKITSKATKEMEKAIEDTIQSATTEVAKRLSGTEVVVKGKLEKEISGFAQSQVDSVKVKICRDWGVLPSLTPVPSQ